MTNASPFRLGLIGWPVEHSLSPVIHRAALKACGLTGDYSLFPIQPFPEGKQALLKIFSAIRKGELTGVNVTVPHKQSVLPFLDRLTLAAENIGAVNTIFYENGNLTGDNYDGKGFIADLKSKLDIEPEEKTALILGAGGSCRAVTYALVNDGWQVMVAARRLEQAQNLVKDIDRGQGLNLSAFPLEANALNTLQPDLIVNTTPVGMSPNVAESPWPPGMEFPKDCFVYDLVYNPNETYLVKQARKAGLKASTGLGMLVEQAALGFQRWTGMQAPCMAMFAAVENKVQ